MNFYDINSDLGSMYILVEKCRGGRRRVERNKRKKRKELKNGRGRSALTFCISSLLLLLLLPNVLLTEAFSTQPFKPVWHTPNDYNLEGESCSVYLPSRVMGCPVFGIKAQNISQKEFQDTCNKYAFYDSTKPLSNNNSKSESNSSNNNIASLPHRCDMALNEYIFMDGECRRCPADFTFTEEDGDVYCLNVRTGETRYKNLANPFDCDPSSGSGSGESGEGGINLPRAQRGLYRPCYSQKNAPTVSVQHYYKGSDLAGQLTLNECAQQFGLGNHKTSITQNGVTTDYAFPLIFTNGDDGDLGFLKCEKVGNPPYSFTTLGWWIWYGTYIIGIGFIAFFFLYKHCYESLGRKKIAPTENLTPPRELSACMDQTPAPKNEGVNDTTKQVGYVDSRFGFAAFCTFWIITFAWGVALLFIVLDIYGLHKDTFCGEETAMKCRLEGDNYTWRTGYECAAGCLFSLSLTSGEYYTFPFAPKTGGGSYIHVVFIVTWHISLIWFVLTKMYEKKLRCFFRLRAPLSAATTVVCQRPAEKEIVIETDQKGYIAKTVKMFERVVRIFYGEVNIEKECAVQVGKEKDFRYFDFQCTRYYYSHSQKAFVKATVQLPTIHDEIIGAASVGLTDAEAMNREKLVGRNSINVEVSSVCEAFWEEFFSLFYFYQFFCLWVWFAFYYWPVGMVILTMIILSGTVKVVVKRVSQRRVKAIAGVTQPVSILRGGKWIESTSDNLVPGDMLKFHANQTVPCDAVIVQGSCVVDESSLTGEPTPIPKLPLNLSPVKQFKKTGEGQKFTLLAGTKIESATGSECIAMCLGTGAQTDKGELVRKILYPAPLSFKFDQHWKLVFAFLLIYGCVAMVACAGFINFLLASWFYGIFTVSQIVSPLIPAVFVTGQANAAQRLSSRRIHCVNLQRMFVAGKVKVFCFDKTGTLTKSGLDFFGALPAVKKKNRLTNANIDENKNNNFSSEQIEKKTSLNDVCSSFYAPSSSASTRANKRKKMKADEAKYKNKYNSDNTNQSKSGCSGYMFDSVVTNMADMPLQCERFMATCHELTFCPVKSRDSSLYGNGSGGESDEENNNNKVHILKRFLSSLRKAFIYIFHVAAYIMSRSMYCIYRIKCCGFLRSKEEKKSEDDDDSHCCIRTSDGVIVGNEVDVAMFKASGYTMKFDSEGGCVVQCPHTEAELKLLRKFEFDRSTMTMSVILEDTSSGERMVFCKGSYESLEKRIKESALPDDYRTVSVNVAKAGFYSITMAYGPYTGPEDVSLVTRESVEKDLLPLGILLFKNELKPDTEDVITELKEGAIRPVMITGDNVHTAVKISRECGLSTAQTVIIADVKNVKKNEGEDSNKDSSSDDNSNKNENGKEGEQEGVEESSNKKNSLDMIQWTDADTDQICDRPFDFLEQLRRGEAEIAMTGSAFNILNELVFTEKEEEEEDKISNIMKHTNEARSSGATLAECTTTVSTSVNNNIPSVGMSVPIYGNNLISVGSPPSSCVMSASGVTTANTNNVEGEEEQEEEGNEDVICTPGVSHAVPVTSPLSFSPSSTSSEGDSSESALSVHSGSLSSSEGTMLRQKKLNRNCSDLKEEFFTENQLTRYTRIYARMKPAQKVTAVGKNMKLGVTAMCGDGANDAGALRIAHCGVAVAAANSDATIVAPFSTTDKSLRAVINVTKFGRCGLASALSGYKALIVYGQTLVGLSIVQYYLGIIPAEAFWLTWDGLVTVMMSWAIMQHFPSQRLTPNRPTSKLIGLETCLSILFQVLWNWFCMVMGLVTLYNQPWFVCKEFDSNLIDQAKWWLKGDNYEGSVVGIIALFQLICTALVFNFGFDYRRAWYRNYWLVGFFVSFFTYASVILLGGPSGFSCLYRTNCGDYSLLKRWEELGKIDKLGGQAMTVPSGCSCDDQIVDSNTCEAEYINCKGDSFNQTYHHNIMPVDFRLLMFLLICCNALGGMLLERLIVVGPVRTYFRKRHAEKKRKKLEKMGGDCYSKDEDDIIIIGSLGKHKSVAAPVGDSNNCTNTSLSMCAENSLSAAAASAAEKKDTPLQRTSDSQNNNFMTKEHKL